MGKASAFILHFLFFILHYSFFGARMKNEK